VARKVLAPLAIGSLKQILPALLKRFVVYTKKLRLRMSPRGELDYFDFVSVASGCPNGEAKQQQAQACEIKLGGV